ncbi:hypothetical protein I2456_16895 [Mycobacterium kubicae]|uniref:Uncharacterized protein n=1 Tax=Mycobacterium kubicae TaxID=120959 RepID=A0AAX1J436_9MYCO|nr:hypothetical protein [Mycobacterium kubicae]QPI36214.1 hypothetical protein I2456_16895 [Mycobacterium kubicae]
MNHAHETAQAGYQEGDQPRGDRCGEQHPEAVSVREQPGGDGAEQCQARSKRHDDRDDGDDGAQCGHHRSLRQFSRPQPTPVMR